VKTHAAILWEVGKDWSVEEIELDPPKKDEVLVRLAGSGLCHSDDTCSPGTCRSVCPSLAGTKAPASSRGSVPESTGSRRATT